MLDLCACVIGLYLINAKVLKRNCMSMCKEAKILMCSCTNMNLFSTNVNVPVCFCCCCEDIYSACFVFVNLSAFLCVQVNDVFRRTEV